MLTRLLTIVWAAKCDGGGQELTVCTKSCTVTSVEVTKRRTNSVISKHDMIIHSPGKYQPCDELRTGMLASIGEVIDALSGDY